MGHNVKQCMENSTFMARELMEVDKCLEIRNSIIQSVISREGLKLQAYNSLQIYSYLIAIRLPTPQCKAS